MWPNAQEPVDLVTFTEEILNGKLHFLCSVGKKRHCVFKQVIKILFKDDIKPWLASFYEVFDSNDFVYIILFLFSKVLYNEKQKLSKLSASSFTENWSLHARLIKRFFKYSTAWKVSKYGVFSSPYFTVFGEKNGPEKTIGHFSCNIYQAFLQRP